jgi:hypothetical protein
MDGGLMFTSEEEQIDGYAREIYHLRSRSPFEMTDERWARIKEKFPASVRVCREDAIHQLEMEE